ncbi:MAG TPA: DUF4870 domain-containing protein [Pyrinomonadaceae bacterium]|nr:DUF4870 domain-containing protein [Pyrinomonadaceae bacterium]
MSYEMQPMPSSALVTPDQRQMGMFLHLSQLAGLIVPLAGIVVPIILWQTQKDKIPALDPHGKMVANWMISALIYAVVSIPLMFLIVGFFTLLAVAVLHIVFPIIGAVKANNGELWNYPLTIKFIK